jgi:arabinofuranosyltransferase
MPEPRDRPWWRRFLVGAGIAWLMLRQWHFRGWIDDDAFISFRYARNWAEGHGLVFNPGERVEGFTNFLWTALLAPAHLLGWDLPTTAQVLGAVVAIATVVLLAGNAGVALSSSSRRNPPLVATLPALALCFSESWAAWSVGGLENVLSGFLVVAAFVVHFRSLSSPTTQKHVWCAVLLSLAALNHPTNVIFAGVIGAHVIMTPQLRRQATLPFFLILGIVLGGSEIARLLYYGDWLPNTWYAKGGMSWAVWQRGLTYFLQVLAAQPLAYLMSIGILVGMVRERLAGHPVRLLAIAALLYSLYIIAVGGEEFPAFRSTVVLVPLFCLMLPATLAWLGEHVGRSDAVTNVMAVVLLVAFTLPLALHEHVRRLDVAIAEGRTALSRTAALMLKNRLPPDTLFAHSGAGLIAFYTNFPWIDTLGLCDHHIARTRVESLGQGAAGHEKGDGRYVWERQPDYVMFPGYPISSRTPGTKSDKELWAIPAFHQRYRPLRVGFTFQAPQDARPQQHSLFLYQRVDP